MESILEQVANGNHGVVAVLVAVLIKEWREKLQLTDRLEKSTQSIAALTDAMRSLEKLVQLTIQESRK